MDISLRETLELEKFKGFRLVAGKKGLDRKVSKIGLLDYEMLSPIKGQFVEGEFALSTLLAAKDTPELIYSSVAYLIESGSSGLGVKDIYYDKLPEAVIELANENDFPIFMFDNSVYFEDIITEFKVFLDAITSEASMSAVIKEVITEKLSEENIKKCFRRLIGHYSGDYACLYVHLKNKMVTETSLAMKAHRLSKRLPVLVVIPYKAGLFLIHKGIDWSEIYELLSQESVIEEKAYACGVGGLMTDETLFQSSLLETLNLTRIADVEGKVSCTSEEMGIYELVMATSGVSSIQHYKKKIIDPILAYDGGHNNFLFETAEAFVRSEGQIKVTAKLMNQHDNTIRYRLSKIKQVIGVEGSDILLYERLSLALRLYWIEELAY